MRPYNQRERERLSLVEARDGQEAATRYARQTMRAYRRAVLNPRHYASTVGFRRTFITSYLECKQYYLAGKTVAAVSQVA